MKKISGFLIVAMIAFTMMGGVAFAGSLTLTPTGALQYPAEAAKSGNVVVNLETGATTGLPSAVVVQEAPTREISYTPTTDLPGQTRIVFQLTNGRWQNSTYFLLNPALDTVAVADIVTPTSLTFVVADTTIVANTTLFLSAIEGAVTNPTLSLDSAMQTAGSNLTIGVPQCFDAVGPIQGGIVSPINLIISYQQFVWDTEAQTKTIDVEPPSLRTYFLDQDGDGGYLHSTRAGVGLINQGYHVAGKTWRISLNSQPGTADIKWTLTGAQMNRLDILEIYNNGNYAMTPNAAGTSATLTVNAEDDWGLHDSYMDTLRMRVDGMGTLNPQQFFISGWLDFADDNTYTDRLLNSTLIITWDINGWQGTVPYIYTEGAVNPAVDTFVKIFNDSTIDAEVRADVTPDTGGIVYPNLLVGTVAAHTVGLFWGRDIAALAGLTVPASFAAVFTVNAPKGNVSAVANQKRPGAVDRNIPVFTGPERWYNYKHN